MTSKPTIPVTLRLPTEVHARVSELTEAEHISLNAALVQAATLWVTERAHGQIVGYAVDDVMTRRSELLARLRDA